MREHERGPEGRQQFKTSVTLNTLDVDDIARLGNGQLLLSDGGLDWVLGGKDLVEFLELWKIVSISEHTEL